VLNIPDSRCHRTGGSGRILKSTGVIADGRPSMETRTTTSPWTRFGTAMAAALALVTAGGVCAQAPINSNLPPGALPSSWDPTYNVCRGLDPKCYHDWVTDRQNRVLIFTRTTGPRHASNGTALGAGLNPPLNANNVAQLGLISWLSAEGVGVDWTEDVTTLTNLNRYKAVIFVNTSRDAMWAHGRAVDPLLGVNTSTSASLDAAKVNLRQYIRAGGGFVGIHNAFGTEYNWPYYEGLLGNANFYDHSGAQLGLARVVGSADSSTSGLPTTFTTNDEWYNLMPYPTNVKFLLTVDETSLANKSSVHPGHGNFHPVSWCQYYDGGRSWVTTLGHATGLYQDGSGFPGQAEFKAHVVKGILSAMGTLPFCTR
jgi:type 1 glutamine amidotransferase